MIYRLLLFLSAALLFGCDKDGKRECEGLESALLSNNEAAVTRIISSMIPDRDPVPSAADRDGFQSHYDALVEKLKRCGLEVEGLCYGCIDTYPPVSEIIVKVTSGSQTVQRVLDLSPDPQRKKFVCKRMHD